MTATRTVEVDGVPVLLAPTSGPARAGLVFRVGSADEHLAISGITHLVEHLALYRHGVADYHYNGTTGVTTTTFLMQGTPDEIVTFVNGVCASLRDLPVARLETEKRLIGTEAAGRGTSVNGQLALWRHGARDFGLCGYPQWGIHTLTVEQVVDWAATRFTRGNAALWLAGNGIPAGLRLDLPDGIRWGLPAESSALPVTPAYFTAGADAVVLETVVPRSAAAALYSRLLERALFRDLRQDRGLSYTAATDYDTDGRSVATVTALVDAQPDQLDGVLDAFIAQVHRLRDTDVSADELAAVRVRALAVLRGADADAGLLPQRATDLLTGFPDRTAAEAVAEYTAVTAADIRDVARAADRSALLMIPDSVPRAPAGYEAAPTTSRFSVTGRRYRSRVDHRVVLVHGPDGVSVDTPSGPLTVLFKECAAMLRYPDGGRKMIGGDAIAVPIEPGLFQIPPKGLAAIDDGVVPAVVIDLPARDPASIPRGEPARAFRARIRSLMLPLRVRSGRMRANGVLLGSLWIAFWFGWPAVAIWGGLATDRWLPVVAGLIGLGAAFPLTKRRD